MATSTGQQFADTISKELIPWCLKAIDDATKMYCRAGWDALMGYLSNHWGITLLYLLAILLLSFVVAKLGRWGWFGSVVYHYLYFGVLFIVGLIWGPEVCASLAIKILLAVLYPVCFLITGSILRNADVMR